MRTINQQAMLLAVKDYVTKSDNLNQIGRSRQAIMFTIYNGMVDVVIMPASAQDYLESYADYREKRYGSFCLFPGQLQGKKEDLLNMLDNYFSFMDESVEI